MNRYTSVDSVDDIHIHNSLGGTMDSQVAISLFSGALGSCKYNSYRIYYGLVVDHCQYF